MTEAPKLGLEIAKLLPESYETGERICEIFDKAF